MVGGILKKRAVWTATWKEEYEFGFYALGEYKIADKGNIRSDIHIFGRAGMSNESVSQLSFFGGAGTTVFGIIHKDDKDAAGFAVAYAKSSSDYRRHEFISEVNPKPAEINFEWTYRFQLHSYIQLQADVQYIRNPGFAADISDAWVTGLRTTISF